MCKYIYYTAYTNTHIIYFILNYYIKLLNTFYIKSIINFRLSSIFFL